MPVVINEFEVVNTPTSTQAATPGTMQPAPSTVLRPEELKMIQQKQRERKLRVYAD